MTLIADNSGLLTGKFTIPSGIPSGKKRVTVLGDQGSFGEAFFEGRGELWEKHNHTTTTIVNRTHYTSTSYYIQNSGYYYYNPWYYGWYQWRWWKWSYPGYWYWGYWPYGWYDPLAQTFRMTETRQITGVELFVRAKGDTPIDVQLRRTENGQPNTNVLATAEKEPSDIATGNWNTWTFPEPVQLSADEEYAIVILCNDADAELAIAEMGKWDAIANRWVTAQPYTVGVMLSSSNNSAWSIHQDKDLAFRLLAPSYTSTTKTIPLGTVTVDNATDIMLAAEHFIPSGESFVRYTATMPDGSVQQINPKSGIQFASPVTGDITIIAELNGTTSESPIVAPGCQLVNGSLTSSANYVSRFIDAGVGSKISVVIDADVPTGADVSVFWKGNDDGDTWTEFGAPTSRALSNEWAELTYTEPTVDEDFVQIKIELTGHTAARPKVSNLRFWTSAAI